jgi:hypothetical protein
VGETGVEGVELVVLLCVKEYTGRYLNMNELLRGVNIGLCLMI